MAPQLVHRHGPRPGEHWDSTRMTTGKHVQTIGGSTHMHLHTPERNDRGHQRSSTGMENQRGALAPCAGAAHPAACMHHSTHTTRIQQSQLAHSPKSGHTHMQQSHGLGTTSQQNQQSRATKPTPHMHTARSGTLSSSLLSVVVHTAGERPQRQRSGKQTGRPRSACRGHVSRRGPMRPSCVCWYRYRFTQHHAQRLLYKVG